MGTAYIAIPNDLQTTKFTRWYTVEKGTGTNACEDATGEILVEVKIKGPQQQQQQQQQKQQTQQHSKRKSYNANSSRKGNLQEEIMEKEDLRVPVTIITKILEGKSMVPKDTNILGRLTTSDPYVIVLFGNESLGKTRIIKKTLDPKWNDELFQITVLKEQIHQHQYMELQVFDHDHFGSDDPMGTVYIRIPDLLEQQQRQRQPILQTTRWYKVERGQGQYFCKDATGSLRVEMHIVSHDFQLQSSVKDSTYHQQKEEINGEDTNNAPMMKAITISILEGRNLAPKDINIYGKATSSDPYVKVWHGQNRLGKTKIIKKTLNPKWEGATFHTSALSNMLCLDGYKEFQLKVYDHDYMGRDDVSSLVKSFHRFFKVLFVPLFVVCD